MGHRGDYWAVQGMPITACPRRTTKLTLRPAEVGKGQQLIAFGIELAMLEQHVALEQDSDASLQSAMKMLK